MLVIQTREWIGLCEHSKSERRDRNLEGALEMGWFSSLVSEWLS